MDNIENKLAKITTFIFDFDGVLSDGMIYVMPDGDMIRGTNAKDGYAIQYALKKGYHVAIISGGFSDTMRLRYRTFPHMDIYLSVPDKVQKLKEYMEENQLTKEQVLIMGDDIPDYRMMQEAGCKCCPSDASEEIKATADYVSTRPGGHGCVRDVIERTLKLQGRWFEEDACIW